MLCSELLLLPLASSIKTWKRDLRRLFATYMGFPNYNEGTKVCILCKFGRGSLVTMGCNTVRGDPQTVTGVFKTAQGPPEPLQGVLKGVPK